MKRVTYTDTAGRKFASLIPDTAPLSHAHMGIILGPPSLQMLGLPTEVEIRLHNQLYDRGLFTPQDVKRRPNAVAAAVQAAYKVDSLRVMALYETRERGILPEESDAEGEG